MSSRVDEIRHNVWFLKSQVDSNNVNPSTIKQFEDSCDNSLTLTDELAEEFGDTNNSGKLNARFCLKSKLK